MTLGLLTDVGMYLPMLHASPVTGVSPALQAYYSRPDDHIWIEEGELIMIRPSDIILCLYAVISKSS